MKKKEILVVDIETSGFLNQGGKIVEIGIVKLNLITGETIPIYDSLIKEDGFNDNHIKSPLGWIFSNSNLSFSEVENAPTLESQREIIQTLFDEYHATAYNKEFDFNFLKSRGFKISELPCPMILATPIINLPSAKYPKVEEAWKYFFGDTGYFEVHRGLDDAQHEALIVYELYKRGDFILPSESEQFYDEVIRNYCDAFNIQDVPLKVKIIAILLLANEFVAITNTKKINEEIFILKNKYFDSYTIMNLRTEFLIDDLNETQTEFWEEIQYELVKEQDKSANHINMILDKKWDKLLYQENYSSVFINPELLELSYHLYFYFLIKYKEFNENVLGKLIDLKIVDDTLKLALFKTSKIIYEMDKKIKKTQRYFPLP